MKKLYISLLAMVGMHLCAQDIEVRWQKDIKSDTQDFLSQLTITIDGQYPLSKNIIQQKIKYSQSKLDC